MPKRAVPLWLRPVLAGIGVALLWPNDPVVHLAGAAALARIHGLEPAVHAAQAAPRGVEPAGAACRGPSALLAFARPIRTHQGGPGRWTLTGEYRIGAPREKVWEALNDPEVLKQSIPGCEEIEKTGENEMAAKVTAKVGPVKAKFAGQVTLSDMNPPESYTISGEGKGGAAGFAKGSAKVHLTPDGDETIMKYEVHASVGGKLAQLGRPTDRTARRRRWPTSSSPISGRSSASPRRPNPRRAVTG